MALLTVNNPKLDKSVKYGYLTAGISLAPFNTFDNKRNVCPNAGNCASVCLYYAGRGQMSNIQKARLKRTKMLLDDRPAFKEQLIKETESFIRKANKVGLKPAMRPNILSDIPEMKVYNYSLN